MSVVKMDLDERDLILLESIRDAEEPVGSWWLVEELEKKGCRTSSASIGRTLYRLESLGFVESQANRGRVITEDGIKAIGQAKNIESIDRFRDRLEMLGVSRRPDEVMMVLQARKAIMKEIARLAAVNISERETLQLKAATEEIDEKSIRGENIAALDQWFFRVVSEASRNSALASLEGMLALMGQYSGLADFARRKFGTIMGDCHRMMLGAMADRNSDSAERAAVRYMETLEACAEEFWRQTLPE